MQRLKVLLFSFVLMSISGTIIGQGVHFGIRAGLNMSQYIGPSEEDADDRFALNNGFHFGMMVEYELNDFLALRTEIMYTQNGTKKQYDGTSYYLFPINNGSRIPVIDSLDLDISISNAYISIPLTLHLRTLEKWEFYGGAYANFMISSIGRGILNFGGSDEETIDHQFQQGLNYNYRKDDVESAITFGNYLIELRANGVDSDVPAFVPAYYNYDSKRGNAFTNIDLGLTAGLNYFLNPGLYIGLRVEYGLRDITNNDMDISYRSLAEDNTLIFRDDDDRHLGFNLSLGFRF